MEQLMENFMAEPVYGLIAVVLAGFIVYSIVKKVLKMVLFFAMIFALYLAYVGLSGRELPTDQEKLKETIIQDVDKAKNSLQKHSSEVIEKASEKAQEEIKKGVKEGVKEAVEEKTKEVTPSN